MVGDSLNLTIALVGDSLNLTIALVGDSLNLTIVYVMCHRCKAKSMGNGPRIPTPSTVNDQDGGVICRA
jgi:hypothetical protein